jgi:hypothetical protein
MHVHDGDGMAEVRYGPITAFRIGDRWIVKPKELRVTLHATREGENITVHATYGPMTFKITENAAHIGHFWSQLGDLLKDNEKPVPYVEVTEPPSEPEIDAEHLGRIMREKLDG